jgi:hypothetical protein
LKLSITYLSNFRPSNTISTDFNFEVNRNKERISCKNFLIFMYLMNYFHKKNNYKLVTIFVKPKKSSLLTILRSPYRHKITRHQLTFCRYYILLTISLDRYCRNFNNFFEIINFYNEINRYLIFVETNVITQHQFKIQLFFKLKNYFNLNKLNLNTEL